MDVKPGSVYFDFDCVEAGLVAVVRRVAKQVLAIEIGADIGNGGFKTALPGEVIHAAAGEFRQSFGRGFAEQIADSIEHRVELRSGRSNSRFAAH